MLAHDFSMSATHHTRALLLRSLDYGEADRVLTLFTEDHGKLSALARGARRSRRRFAGALEAFAVLEIEFAQGRGSLSRLVDARLQQGHLSLLASLPAMQAGGRAFDILRRLLPEAHPEPELFGVAVGLLAALDTQSGQALAEQWRAGFVVQSLARLGFWPSLSTCGSCGRRPRDDQAVQFHAPQGHLVCRQCGGANMRISARGRQLLNALSGADWQDAAVVAWPDMQRVEVVATGDAVLRARGVV